MNTTLELYHDSTKLDTTKFGIGNSNNIYLNNTTSLITLSSSGATLKTSFWAAF